MSNKNVPLLSLKKRSQDKVNFNSVEKALKAEEGKSTSEEGMFQGLACLVELKEQDPLTKIQYRDCLIDYHSCPNSLCIKKLV